MSTSALPPEFWAVPDETFDTSYEFLYTQVISRLRTEAEDVGGMPTLNAMLIERVAHLYIHIRSKEAANSFAHDRAYKETMAMWLQMAASLNKSAATADDMKKAKLEILNGVTTVIGEVLSEMEPKVAKQLSERFAHRFETLEI